MKILIDYDCNILYSSQYIECLRNSFDISFIKKPFDLLSPKENLFLFSCVDDKKVFNIVIDFADSPTINEPIYKWCHIYGKINFNIIHGNYHNTVKLVKMPPSFGVKIWGKYTAIFYTIFNYLKFYPAAEFRRLLSNYVMQKNRLKLSEYTKQVSDSKYIFFASTLWNKQNHSLEESETNNNRANFIRACKSISGMKFEGGFSPNEDRGNYNELFMGKRLSLNEYVNNINRSACVFNTPAVYSCHGWKLGEYLALGKAIISTPLYNELPMPLEHGVNIHFVLGEVGEITEAIKKICLDDDYRKTLETGAYNYWLNYGHPMKAIESLFKKLNIPLIHP